ncbi:uncharacterized protein AC631_03052 [Debaryomyces fabryi]|uniref:Uncharacterized protein n=1 Tax=Debaryomyces fabryi TaxID=58627 RepID=A0A0V1PYN2_9ASCO|nr:uncharacterized protein AC631_03052 [Debaryomyces fabryi]KSA01173.1 hypothetical protein AC631_03052 [Debaryomyces fabryi]CUM49015.1 unnamed protein product [Debaryomyces fabryi]
MSNIPDITSLSDLLNTSPSQPLVENQQDRNPNLLLDQAEKSQNQIYEYTRNIQQQKNEDNEDINTDTEENRLKVSRSGLPDDKIEELEKLLNQQSIKLDLSNERNDLIKKRTSLKNSVEELRVKVKYLQNTNEKQRQKDRLGKLLEQSDKAFIESQKPKTVEAPVDQDDNEYLLNNLHVLPSNDWIKRLNMAKKFYPYLEISEAQNKTLYNDKKSAFVRSISFTVTSPYIFRIPIEVSINPSDESILSISIPNDDNKEGVITNFSLLSPSFTRVMIQNYMLNGKVDLVMYSLNSLSITIRKRISTLYKLLRNFRQYIKSDSYIGDLIQEQAIEDDSIVFSILKSVDNLEFTIPVNNNSKDNFIIKLQWEIVIANSINADCASDTRVFITKEKDIHAADEKVVKSSFAIRDANSLFVRLSKEYGIFNAVCILLNNIFHISSG